MQIKELKNKFIKEYAGLDKFENIISFIDFGNVNYWFEEDRQGPNNNLLKDNEKLSIDLQMLKDFSNIFSKDIRFYYGHDEKIKGSLGFIRVARNIYGKSRVFTKQVQKIKNYLSNNELSLNTRYKYLDKNGTFIFIPKCNFDVEITVDAIKLINNYDSICLFSSDADFIHLARFLKNKGKKIILIKGGYIVRQWKNIADLIINAQEIKKYITKIKQKPSN